jgi:hypothetical protein
MEEVETLKKKFGYLLEKEKDCLSRLFELSTKQSEIIKICDFERLKDLTKQQEELGKKIKIFGEERKKLEQRLGKERTSQLKTKDKIIGKGWSEIRDLVSKIKKMDEENISKITQRMEEILKKLGGIKRTRKIRKAYFKRIDQPLYIDKSIE